MAAAKKGKGRPKKKQRTTLKTWTEAVKKAGIKGRVYKGTDDYDKVKKVFDKMQKKLKKTKD